MEWTSYREFGPQPIIVFADVCDVNREVARMSRLGTAKATWAAALLLACASALEAQNQLSQFTVRATHPLARFSVDGKIYTGAASFLWPEGSTHVLEFFVTDGPYQYSPEGRTRFLFGGWSDAAGLLQPANRRTQVVTANSRVSSYTLEVAAEYEVFIQFYDPGPGAPPGSPEDGCVLPGPEPPGAGRPGVVLVGQRCLWRSTRLWLQEGRHVLNAFPYPGFAFTGWSVSTGGTSAFLRTLDVTSPLDVSANFRPAKRISFKTEPPGLMLLIDRTPTPTPVAEPCHEYQPLPVAAPAGLPPMCVGEVDWALDSRHSIGAPSPQSDTRGRLWLFDSFSNGMGNHATYTVQTLNAERIVARFVRGAQVSFLTEPAGLKLEINGRANWPSYNFVARPGEKFALAAPAEQVGSDGRRYVFRRWSNGAAAAHQIEIPPEAVDSGYRLTAAYELLSQTVIHSEPAGAVVDVDGAPCQTPCVLDRPDGTEVRLSPPAQWAISQVYRLEFAGWSDGGPRERRLRISGGERRDLVARYLAHYRLETLAVPAGGATFELDPPSPEGFYPAGTYVTVKAHSSNGYRFRRWTGDAEGTYPVAGLTLSAGRQVVALLDEVPYIAPAGVRSAAGETPSGAVAPGSLISIYGASLALYPEVGPRNPMAQALGGATVRVGERLLALAYSAPDQINAWLPYDLPEGNHTLVVSRESYPDATAEFKVARNAPGLFSRAIESKLFALAAHEDGSPLLPESPARRGELVSIYATGLGPYERRPVYGFLLPAAPPYRLVDLVEVFVGGRLVRHEFAGGAPGYAGCDVIRLRITDELPRNATVELRVRVAGAESNTVLLPLE
jgi:uncharacterized protein (TIGR03437 family)